MGTTSIILITASFFFTSAYCSIRNQPNIVFIMADDVGYNDVGYHNKLVKTPFLDQLAKEGVRLESYYVQPICTPTRSQFMSGRYQIHTGLQHGVISTLQPNALPRDSPTLADKLSDAGYSTYAVGKWHLGFYKKEFLPTRRGFDRFYGFYMGAQDYFRHNRCIFGSCGVDLHDDTPDSFKPVFNESGTYSTHLFTRKAEEFIQTRNKTRPFFLYLSYQAIHGPQQVPYSYLRIQDRNLPEKRRKTIAMATALDEGVKKVVERLKKENVWNNTVLVFSTDNGGTPRKGGSNLPLKGNKGRFFEGGIRGVGIAASPLFSRTGYVNNELIHVADWFPTFIALANGSMEGTRDIAGVDQWNTISRGLKSPKTEILHGIDPLTRSKAPFRNRGRYGGLDNIIAMKAAIRIGDYKLLTGLGGRRARRISQKMQLYNIALDPLERNNLVSKEKGRVTTMLRRLRDYYKTSVKARNPKMTRWVKPVNGVWMPWS